MTFMALKIYFPAVRISCQQCSHIAIPCLNISPDHHTLLHILESYHKLLYQHSLIHCSVLHISCSYAHIISKLSLQTGGYMTFSKLYPYLRTNQIIYLPMVSSTSKHKPHYDNSTRLHTKTLAMCIQPYLNRMTIADSQNTNSKKQENYFNCWHIYYFKFKKFSTQLLKYILRIYQIRLSITTTNMFWLPLRILLLLVLPNHCYRLATYLRNSDTSHTSVGAG